MRKVSNNFPKRQHRSKNKRIYPLRVCNFGKRSAKDTAQRLPPNLRYARRTEPPQAGNTRTSNGRKQRIRPVQEADAPAIISAGSRASFRLSPEIEVEQPLGGDERTDLVVEHLSFEHGDLGLDARVTVETVFQRFVCLLYTSPSPRDW